MKRKNKRQEKKPYLSSDAVVCSLATVKKIGENKYQSVHHGAIIGVEKQIDNRGQLFRYVQNSIEGISYKILTEYEVELGIRNGELLEGEPYCYSSYDGHYTFKEIYEMENKEDIIKFLIEYNKKNNTTIYWTFLDEKEKKELDYIKIDNNSKYLEFYH